MFKSLKGLIPKGFLWRLTFLNTLVIATLVTVSGWAIYNTACTLVEGMGSFEGQRQGQFSATLLQYLWVFTIAAIVIGSMLHFYFTKILINPLRQLIESTKRMQKGEYPEPVEVVSEDEVGMLMKQYNGLIGQLQANEQYRHKLVSDLSHEFRTPLANLSGYLQALETGVISGDADLYASLHKESTRLIEMVEQLEQLKVWDFTTTETIIHKKTVNIAEQIRQVVLMFEMRLTKADIPVIVDVEAKDIAIQIEGVQQVLNNLLDNAIQYYEGEAPILVTGEVRADAYYISVTGRSKEFTETDSKQLFDRFYRTDVSRNRETGGTGLGLAIAKEIVEHHHGEIGVDQLEAANRFWFTLPYIS